MNNGRIETYIILGMYFAIGLFIGYAMGKGEIKTSEDSESNYHRYNKTTTIIH